jgi:hypothetical protein
MEGGHGPATQYGGAAQPLAAPPMCETTLVHLWRCPFAYKDPQREKPKDPIHFLETHRDPPPSSTQDREGPEALPGTLRRGESPPEVFFIAMLASGAMSE